MTEDELRIRAAICILEHAQRWRGPQAELAGVGETEEQKQQRRRDRSNWYMADQVIAHRLYQLREELLAAAGGDA